MKPTKISELKQFFADFLSNDPCLSDKLRNYGSGDLRCLDTWKKAYEDRENLKSIRLQELGQSTTCNDQKQPVAPQKKVVSLFPVDTVRKPAPSKSLSLPTTQSTDSMDKNLQVQKLEKCLSLEIPKPEDHLWMKLKGFVQSVAISFWDNSFTSASIPSQEKHIYEFDSRECHYQVAVYYREQKIEITESNRSQKLAKILSKRMVTLEPADIEKSNIQYLQEAIANNTLTLLFQAVQLTKTPDKYQWLKLNSSIRFIMDKLDCFSPSTISYRSTKNIDSWAFSEVGDDIVEQYNYRLTIDTQRKDIWLDKTTFYPDHPVRTIPLHESISIESISKFISLVEGQVIACSYAQRKQNRPIPQAYDCFIGDTDWLIPNFAPGCKSKPGMWRFMSQSHKYTTQPHPGFLLVNKTPLKGDVREKQSYAIDHIRDLVLILE